MICTPCERVEGREYYKKKSGGKKVRCCKKCGRPGHRADGCQNTEAGVFNTKGTPDTDTFEINEDVISEINDMLTEGKGSREIAEYYGIDIKKANKAIAKAKGIELPE